MSRKNIKNTISKIFNILLIAGILLPMAYFLYRFVVVLLEKSEMSSDVISAVFSAWIDLSGLFLKLLLISGFFLTVKIITVLPSLFRKVSRYHRGTEVSEITLIRDEDALKNIDAASFLELYQSAMYDAKKTAALLPVVLYAIATDNPDSDVMLGIVMNKDFKSYEWITEAENIKKQVAGKINIALSYYTCTTPENEYHLQGDLITRIKDPADANDEPDEKSLYVACSGSGSYRPIRLKSLSPRGVKKSQNEYLKNLKTDDDIWFFDEFSSTLVNVKTK